MIFTSGFGNLPQKISFSVVVLLVCLCAQHPSMAYAEDANHKQWSQVPALANYSVKFGVRDATCFDNGQVGFVIVNKNNNTPITSDQLASLGLNDFRVGYQGTSIDTTTRWYDGISYQVDTTWVQMESGTFNIKLEFSIPSGIPEDFYIVDTIVSLTVVQIYQQPEITALSSISHDGVRLGNIPTLPCGNTGRIQVRVDGGALPFHFRVVNHNDATQTLYDTIISSVQTDEYGNINDYDSARADYYRYYTFNNMPEGVWDFYFVDGCNYGFLGPATMQSVETIESPYLKDVEIWASSGNVSDVNVLKINAVLAPSEYPVYMRQFAQYMEYRFVNASANTAQVPFKSLFPNGLPSSYDGTSDLKVTIYDTIRLSENTRYCDFWGMKDTLQLRVNGGLCGSYTTWDTISVYNTNREYYDQGDEQITDNIIQLDACHQSIYKHKDNFYFAYKENHPNWRTAGKDHVAWRYHFTYPIVWEYKDFYDQTKVYKRDTIWGEDEDNIARHSVLTSQDILAQNASAFNNNSSVRILFSLTDDKGCELYNGDRQIDINQIVLPSASPAWEIVKSDPVCCNKRRTITIREKNGIEGANYEGMTIQMTNCPNNAISLYGFTAQYISGAWSITKNDPINGPDVTPLSNGMGVVLSEYCLPPGNYRFAITGAPCVGNTSTSVSLQNIEYTDIEEGGAQHAIVSDCIQNFVTYTSGRMGKTTVSPSGTTTEYVPTRFKMVNGPIGGYDPLDTRTYRIPDPTHNIPGDSVHITVYTDSTQPYVFQIYPENSSGLCNSMEIFDTVWYNGNSLSFDFAMALLCNKGSTMGPVYVLAKQGVPPYTYTLYSGPNETGSVLASIQTDTAKFSDITMNIDHQLSCKIEDACGAYYTINFYPQILAELQKTWFDNGAKVLSTCEGTEVHLHSLQLGSIFTYNWYKVVPDGEDVLIAETSNPSLFLPREADTAIYRVEIGVESCSAPLKDSLWINPMPAPYLNMSSDVTVCATEDAEFWFTPISRQKDEHGNWTDVSFKVVVQTPLGKDTLSYYNVPSGNTVYHTINPLLETIIYPVSIDDGRCDYEVPDDTLFVHISNNIISPCVIPTWHDTVCYNSDALLKASCIATADQHNPNELSWYADFELSQFLKSDALTHSGDTSYYTINGLKERTYRYVTVAKEGYCPPSNLTASGGVVTMSSAGGTTSMSCITGVLFYDDGGADNDYSANSSGASGSNQTHLFVSVDNRPVVIHFDTLSLADGSSLSIFSGESINPDSLLIQFSGNEESIIHYVPDVIMSKGNKMLVYFKPGPKAGLGWTAYVRSAPAIAIADVIIPSKTQFSDRVCQSQTKGYYNPAMFALEIPGVNAANLGERVKKSGSYYYAKTVTSSKGCDSTISFILTVDPAPYVDTMVITTSVTGFTWHTKQGDSTYYKPGVHVVNTPDANGCDNLEVLKLVVIEVSNPDVDACYGDSAVVGIFVDTYDSVKTANELIDNELHTVGDILCQDASGARKILNPDSFLLNTGLTPLGVVVYMNPDNTTGIAMSLTDANDTICFPWAEQKGIGGTITCSSSWEAILDTNGYGNTQFILTTVGMTGDDTEDFFKLKNNVPATFYCYYYNPYTSSLDVMHHGCYLPSVGEMYLYYAYRTIINKSLEKLSGFGAKLPRDGMEVHYWTSTGGNAASNASCVNGKGQLCMHHEKSRVCYYYDGNYVTRAVRAFFKF